MGSSYKECIDKVKCSDLGKFEVDDQRPSLSGEVHRAYA
jgi:hypothetical protein